MGVHSLPESRVLEGKLLRYQNGATDGSESTVKKAQLRRSCVQSRTAEQGTRCCGCRGHFGCPEARPIDVEDESKDDLLEELAKLLNTWSERLVRLPQATEIEVLSFKGDAVEGVETVTSAIDACHRSIYRCRHLGVVSAEELAVLSRSSMFLQVELAFTTLADLEEHLTDTGVLSLVDLPSPEHSLWASQDVSALYRSTLRGADGVLVVIDASKHEVPQWVCNMLRDIFKQDEEMSFEERSALRRADTWIVANRMDQLPEFFCKEGKEFSKKVMERQHENYKDIIVDQEHVIPIAARLSSLAIYGKEKIQETLSAQLLSRLERQAWFAQACALLFGIRWIEQVKDVDQTRWRSSMRELMLLGQVTGPLANSVLKTAYVKMLPRSVTRAMQELSQLTMPPDRGTDGASLRSRSWTEVS
ncbi:unnamed protein product [Durusdinium trenchii]|uniref:Uncharacterized protein n=1 Tax=Durusdinium trenchii TaxID=1381693 RepID=A0ABP0N2I9_9DINO